MTPSKTKSITKIILEWIGLLSVGAIVISTLTSQGMRITANEKMDAQDHVNIQYRIDCITYSISNMTMMLSIATNNLDYIKQRLDRIAK